jgi:branched-chain amino acid transport system substrate-binding protein
VAVIGIGVAAWLLWLLLLKPTAPAAIKHRTVKVGLLAPFTGDNLIIGNGVRRAVQLALKDLDLQDVDIQVVERDSNCDADTAERAMKDLVEQQNVIAVVGDYCSSSTLAALPLATRNHVVFMSPAATSPQLSGASPYFFRTVPTDVQQGEFAAKLMTDRKYAKVAILHDDDAYGIGLGKSFADNLTKLGGKIVANEVFTADGVDINKQLDRIKAAKPDAMYIVSVSSTSDKAILLRARSLGLTAALYGSEALKDQALLDDTGAAAEGLYVTAIPGGNSNYLDNYQAEFDDKPPIYSAQTYHAFTAIAKTIADGANTGDDIKQKLATIDFTGVTSRIKFSSTGDISAGTYEVVTVKGGKFVLSSQ